MLSVQNLKENKDEESIQINSRNHQSRASSVIQNSSILQDNAKSIETFKQ